MTCFDYDDHDEPADYDDEPVPPCEHRLKFWARTDDHTRTLTCSDCGERFTVIHTLGTPFAQAFAPLAVRRAVTPASRTHTIRTTSIRFA